MRRCAWLVVGGAAAVTAACGGGNAATVPAQAPAEAVPFREPVPLGVPDPQPKIVKSANDAAIDV